VIIKEEWIGGQRLILGDCRDIIGGLEFDAICCDPPYGIGITRSNRLAVSRGMGGGSWDDDPADISWLPPLNVPSIVWGGNYFGLPAHRGFLIWDKNNAGRDFADCEMAWTNIDMVARIFQLRPMNMDGGKVHPTQKPVALIEWCLGFLPNARTILDPFAGSGTLAVAAYRLGRESICIERDPQYFDIACKRVDEATRQPDMFIAPPPPAPKQEGFDL
jgi:hypothetical protein